jgi:hypothetical protein
MAQPAIRNPQSSAWELTEGALCALRLVIISFIPSLKGSGMTQSKGHFEIVVFVVFLLTWAFCRASPAVQFAGGTGEPNTPYQIATAEQLIAISSDPNLYNKCFILTADIDLDPDLPGRKVFQQAVLQWTTSRVGGTVTIPFEGRFDGNGHTIRNWLVVSTGSTLPIGFFNSIAAKGVVCNLHLENVLLTGIAPYYAGLAGKSEGSVVNCSVSGTIVAPASESASSSVYAGLVGQNTGLVANCHSDCDVFGYMAAGLVGSNDATGRVVSCSASGFISGPRYAGGLVYQNAGTVQYCSADGYLTSASAGGLVSDNHGMIRESYAMTAMQGGAGLASVNSGTIVNCYTLPPSFGTYMDGLVSTNNGTILTSYSTSPAQVRTGTTRGSPPVAYSNGPSQCVYYLDPNKKSGQASSPFSGSGVSLSPDEMKQAASFVGFDFYGDPNDGPSGHWFMPADGYPVLAWQTEITGLVGIPDVSGLDADKAKLLLDSMGFTPGSPSSDYSRSAPAGLALYTQPAGYAQRDDAVGVITSLGVYSFSQNPGDGSTAKPYQISTPSQLDSLYHLSSSAAPQMGQSHFILTADIDLSRYIYADSLFGDFAGEFNGNGHTIRNLQIVAPTSSSTRCGLFATISVPGITIIGKAQPSDLAGTVHDLTIEQAYLRLTGSGPAGILTGQNGGQVLRCKATGQVLCGGSTAGGLVGNNSGQITDCRFSGRIIAAGSCGGLAGSNSGTVTRCCARDIDVSGGSIVGGLLGSTGPYASVSAEACYATGTVRGTSSVGGLVGQNGGIISGTTRGGGGGTNPLPSTSAVTVRQCYAACSVTGQQNVGGCIGWTSTTAQAESCFFLDPNDAGGPNNGQGTPLTAQQLKHQASFPTWDFTDTWTVCEGRDYPRLKWEDVTCP